VKVDPNSPDHPYQQVAGYLRAEIRAGRIGPRVPSALQLASDTGASVATVKRAFKVLHDEGVIYLRERPRDVRRRPLTGPPGGCQRVSGDGPADG
jgi:DNA-binding transcriptional regulator YhcF (GntR family)